MISLYLKLRQETAFGHLPLIDEKPLDFLTRWRRFWRLVNRGMREIAYRLSGGLIYGDQGVN